MSDGREEREEQRQRREWEQREDQQGHFERQHEAPSKDDPWKPERPES
ncbi:MAG TPA: hypothetical protein VMV57_08940 [Terracidiphilus sp.]|nr:hypothetical protein [Terracidiphilus sp.]